MNALLIPAGEDELLEGRSQVYKEIGPHCPFPGDEVIVDSEDLTLANVAAYRLRYRVVRRCFPLGGQRPTDVILEVRRVGRDGS